MNIFGTNLQNIQINRYINLKMFDSKITTRSAYG
jgi:hypothetical protein